jgi:signal transduction histidine kinase
VTLSSLPEFEAKAREEQSVWIPWIGAALTILSSALVWSLARTRAVAIALADERSAAARSALAEVELQRDRLRAQSVELERARDEALAAASVKSEFIATVSHEIRTPMNGIVGMTSLLVESPLLPEQREYASHIRRSADQLLAMVNDLLDFSKLEAGRLRVEALPFDIRATCEEAAEAVRPLAEAKHLQVRLDIGPSLPAKAVGDALRIRQVLVNLLGNAVKFSSEGEVVLSADAPERTGGDILLRLRVKDHGIGIAPQVLPLLFQPFTQAETSTTRRFGGSGLGLAISKRLVELMGGKIGAESRLGEGSTFEVLLRLPV